jgi:hypothetical protein
MLKINFALLYLYRYSKVDAYFFSLLKHHRQTPRVAIVTMCLLFFASAKTKLNGHMVTAKTTEVYI